jgi:hypothetical protein
VRAKALVFLRKLKKVAGILQFSDTDKDKGEEIARGEKATRCREQTERLSTKVKTRRVLRPEKDCRDVATILNEVFWLGSVPTRGPERGKKRGKLGNLNAGNL